jgi:hypothetical protein
VTCRSAPAGTLTLANGGTRPDGLRRDRGPNIGRDLYTGLPVDYFPGQISDVETWNSALTPGQVATLG